MDWTAYVRTTLSRVHPNPDDDVIVELADHARAAFEAERADGRSTDEAETTVRAHVDGWCRDISHRRARGRTPVLVEPPAASTSGVDGWMQDVRYGVRLLARQWPYTLAAVLTTALGIGAVGTLFSVAYGVLMRPLPWRDAHELVRVWETREGGRGTLPTILTNKTMSQWLQAPTTISDAAAWVGSARVTIGRDGDARRVLALPVTANLFPLLGARPLHGALFQPSAGAPPKDAILSHGLWREQFGGDRDIINQSITIDGESFRVTGVMPADFYFPTPEVRLWTPYQVRPVATTADGATRSISMFNGIARLRPGHSVEQAAAEATARARTGPRPGMVDIAVFGTKGDAVIHALSYPAFLAREVRQPLLVFLGAVMLLFLTAIASISSMQLARSTARRRELALRAALGAGAARLARQLLVESTLLGLAGGVAGIILMAALHLALPTLLPADFPRASDITMDPRVVLAAFGTAFLAGLAFGVLPALHTRRLNLVSTLSEDGLAPVGAGRRSGAGRWRAVIMTGQVAVATVLLIGAALLGRTFVALWETDRGYEPRGVLSAMVSLPERSFTPAARAAFLRDVMHRLEGMSGVSSAGFTSILPLSNYDALSGFTMPGPSGPIDVHAGTRTISPEYFDAMGIRVVDGRGFTSADTPSADAVVIVNQTFVATYLQGIRAVGHRLPIAFEDSGPQSHTIAGVIEDVQPSARGERPRPEIYASAGQMREGLRFDEPVIVVRTAGDPAALTERIRAAAADVHRAAIVDNVATMEDRLRLGLARPRLYAVVLGGFSVLAVLIAGTGLFGVLAYSVAQRRREIGVRAALGASPRNLVALVLRQSAVMTFTGLAIGLAIALLSVRWLSSFLFGIGARDPLSFVLVPLVLLVVATLSSLVPARRAANVDPLTAMRT